MGMENGSWEKSAALAGRPVLQQHMCQDRTTLHGLHLAKVFNAHRHIAGCKHHILCLQVSQVPCEGLTNLSQGISSEPLQVKDGSTAAALLCSRGLLCICHSWLFFLSVLQPPISCKHKEGRKHQYLGEATITSPLREIECRSYAAQVLSLQLGWKRSCKHSDRAMVSYKARTSLKACRAIGPTQVTETI